MQHVGRLVKALSPKPFLLKLMDSLFIHPFDKVAFDSLQFISLQLVYVFVCSS